MEGLIVLGFIVAAIVAVALAAMAYGTDSREGFAPRQGILG